MNVDDLGRQAGVDARRVAERHANELPGADDLVRRGERRRAVRLAAAASVVVLLIGGAALAQARGRDAAGGIGVATGSPDRAGAPAPSATAPSSVGQVGGDSTTEPLPPDPTPDPAPAPGPGGDLGTEPRVTTSTTRPGDPSTFTSSTSAVPRASTTTTNGPSITTTSTSTPARSSTTTSTLPRPGHDWGNVSGTVTAGPACPGPVGGTPCPDRPIVATITFAGDFGPPRSVTSDAQGRYSSGNLMVGSYTVTATSAFAMSCNSYRVGIDRFTDLTIDISCNTGML